jgi:hypothetical protein
MVELAVFCVLSCYPSIRCAGILREAAFKERRKIHDIVLEGIELALQMLRKARNKPEKPP